MKFARSWIEATLSASAVTAAAALAIASGVAAPLQRLAADALVRIGAAQPPDAPADLPDVTLVAIDPQSVRALPNWPWPRSVHAQVVRRLDAAGAKAIAIDIDFSVAREPRVDAELARAISESGRVVLAAFRQIEALPGGAGEIEVATLPTPTLAGAAAGIGSVLMPVEPDGVVRFAPRSSRIAERDVPSLAAAALAVAQGEAAPVAGRPLRIDWRRAGPAVRTISLVGVIEGRFDPALISGRVVMIGATAAEFQDLWSTPLGPARPGVLIQAIAYRTLAAEQAGLSVLAAPARGVSLLLVALIGVTAASLSGLSHSRRSAALAILGGAWLLAAFGLVVSRGLLLDCVVPVGQLAGHYVLGLESVRQRFQRRLVERERSLVTLFSVGEATAAPASGDVLGVALSLLGDVVGASGVALLRASPEGELDGRRIDWGRASGGAIGDEEAAASCLRTRDVRVYGEGAPGGGAGLAVYAPLFAGEVPVGVLVVERAHGEPLDPTQLRMIATVGTQVALSVENLRLVEGLRATFDSSVEAIASAVEARDGYTQLHCRRLALFSSVMGHRLGLGEREIEAIRLGALLHDVGKIGIRDEILLKPGRFTRTELVEMQRHADIGHGIVSGIHGLSPDTLACVRHHHECWDGSGYPSSLAGDAIPLAARIVTVVDVWDALSTARPYKPALPQDEVRRLLRKGRGERFEPELIDLFLRLLDEEGEELLGVVQRSVA